VDRAPAKDAASYYIQASESGGEPPGRWWGAAAKGAAVDCLLDGRYRMAADGTCQVWRGEGARQSEAVNGRSHLIIMYVFIFPVIRRKEVEVVDDLLEFS